MDTWEQYTIVFRPELYFSVPFSFISIVSGLFSSLSVVSKLVKEKKELCERKKIEFLGYITS